MAKGSKNTKPQINKWVSPYYTAPLWFFTCHYRIICHVDRDHGFRYKIGTMVHRSSKHMWLTAPALDHRSRVHFSDMALLERVQSLRASISKAEIQLQTQPFRIRVPIQSHTPGTQVPPTSINTSRVRAPKSSLPLTVAQALTWTLVRWGFDSHQGMSPRPTPTFHLS